MEMYEWQDRLYDEWAERGFIGCVQAMMGAGKTRAGAIALKRYLDAHPGQTAIVVSPSSQVSKSWRDELEAQGVSDGVDVMTYQVAVNNMRKGATHYDLMIADECHRLATPVQGRVLELNPRAVLGLSATPDRAVEILGRPFMEISAESANIAPYVVHFVEFRPTPSEMERYNRATERMEARAREVSGGAVSYLPPGRDRNGWNSYDALARRRREVCYMMESRIPLVSSLVQRILGADPRRRIVVYFERTKQVSALHDELMSYGLDSATHTQEHSDLERFSEREVNVLIACRSLREGWNDPSISCVIMGSINTGVIVNTQTMGRALRLDPDNPGKRADIYLLMAQGTSDVNVMGKLTYAKGHSVREVM